MTEGTCQEIKGEFVSVDHTRLGQVMRRAELDDVRVRHNLPWRVQRPTMFETVRGRNAMELAAFDLTHGFVCTTLRLKGSV